MISNGLQLTFLQAVPTLRHSSPEVFPAHIDPRQRAPWCLTSDPVCKSGHMTRHYDNPHVTRLPDDVPLSSRDHLSSRV